MNKVMPAFSLHNHSFYCGHGKGSPRSYINYVDSNDAFAVFGFSEHCPVPDGRWKKTRMFYEDLDLYENDVRKLKVENSHIQILLGAECDWDDQYRTWYTSLKEERGYDYLIGAVHCVSDENGEDILLSHISCTKKQLFEYTDKYIAMLSSGLFLFGAHPDLIACSYLKWDEDFRACSKAIIECAASLNIPLEINASGFNKKIVKGNALSISAPYPDCRFWELAAQNSVKAVIGADAHSPNDITLCIHHAIRFASMIDIEYFTKIEELWDNEKSRRTHAQR